MIKFNEFVSYDLTEDGPDVVFFFSNDIPRAELYLWLEYITYCDRLKLKNQQSHYIIDISNNNEKVKNMMKEYIKSDCSFINKSLLKSLYGKYA